MLKLIKICKEYPLDQNQSVKALKNINLEIGEKGFVSILGHSGCGKTTLLNVIGGLDHYTSGDLVINGVSTKDFKDKDWDLYRNKKIGFVFQSYNLIPHLTILENVEIPLTLSGMSQGERKNKAIEALYKVGLAKEINKKPNQLSGGQMQRVAIARSIVSDPEIILADEPTGALDSKTSVVIMDILKEISKSKLVIMVTHNNELAEEYSDRIISMSDGEIISDESKLDDDEKDTIKPILGKTSMSFFSSFKMALKNIFTKKGRVAMISVASSFGVIGVGLVLAVSNGFSGYINRLEEATASNSPITISSTVVSYKTIGNEKTYDKYPDSEEVKIYDSSTTTTATVHRNEITNEYLTYLDDIEMQKKYKGTVASKLINYTNPQYFVVGKTLNEDQYSLINTNKGVSSFTSSITNLASLPNTVMHEFYGDETYIRSSYDILKGTYPVNDGYYDSDGNLVFEISLVVDQYNRVNKTTLQNLGLISDSYESDIISFNDILNTEFMFYKNDDVYYFNEDNPDSEYDTATYRTIEKETYTSDDGKETFTIPEHKVVQYYDYSKSQTLLKELYEGTYSIIHTGKDETGTINSKPIKLKVSSILRVKEDALLDYMPISFCYTNGFKEYANSVNKNSNIANNIQYAFDIDLTKLKTLVNSLTTNTDSDILNDNSFISSYNSCITSYTATHPNLVYNSKDGTFKTTSNSTNVWSSYSNGLKYVYGYGGEVSIPSELMNILTVTDTTNYKSQLTKAIAYLKAYEILHTDEENAQLYISMFNYLGSYLNNASMIESIIIFPSSITNKTLIKEYLDSYNNNKLDSEQIIYSDLIGTLTDSLGQLVNVISIVLIVFASISLVVSCVMTGIIMYNSVIERIKEIGILRAVGARKKDVGRLFKSESIIIGLFSGVIGVVITLLISIPINIIINNLYPDYNIGSIASLAWYAALILIIISAVLAYISGIIPARSAARKDPVIALRSE